MLRVRSARPPAIQPGLDLGLYAYAGEEAIKVEQIVADLTAKYGIEPIKFGNRRDTWSGLSDEELAEFVGAGNWYMDHYGLLSDASHVNVGGIWRQLRVRAGGSSIQTSLLELREQSKNERKDRTRAVDPTALPPMLAPRKIR